MNETIMLDNSCIGLVVHSRKHGTKVIRVSAEDYVKVSPFKWYVADTGTRGKILYANTGAVKDGKKVGYMHRLLTNYPAKGFHVDHDDENGLNNSRPNLNVLTHGENIWKGRNGKRQRYGSEQLTLF